VRDTRGTRSGCSPPRGRASRRAPWFGSEWLAPARAPPATAARGGGAVLPTPGLCRSAAPRRPCWRETASSSRGCRAPGSPSPSGATRGFELLLIPPISDPRCLHSCFAPQASLFRGGLVERKRPGGSLVPLRSFTLRAVIEVLRRKLRRRMLFSSSGLRQMCTLRLELAVTSEFRNKAR